jgi:hypothetical protein
MGAGEDGWRCQGPLELEPLLQGSPRLTEGLFLPDPSLPPPSQAFPCLILVDLWKQTLSERPLTPPVSNSASKVPKSLNYRP